MGFLVLPEIATLTTLQPLAPPRSRERELRTVHRTPVHEGLLATMLHPLVIGLGRSGAGLHLRALAKARDAAADLFATGPSLACDTDPAARRAASDVRTVDSVSAAAELVDPESTVAHVCTPPGERVPVLTELAVHGIRRAVVEKPLATGLEDLAAVRQLTAQHGMDVVVVAHWLDSALTARLAALVRDGRLGSLRAISVAQHKPRFTRSAAGGQHPTAFDVEVPHSLGLVLGLAGPAELLDADCTDMHCDGTVLPRVGGARLSLQHRTGVRTDIASDLTAPVQERRVALEFTRGTAIGHYPISDRDDHAQLVVAGRREVFRDDALTGFVLRAYRDFHQDFQQDPGQDCEHDCGQDAGQDPEQDLQHDRGRGHDAEFERQCEVVRLVSEAKRHCASAPAAVPGAHGVLAGAAAERSVDHAR